MSYINVNITKDQNEKLRKMILDECAAYKNWIVTAVEVKQFDRAEKLVAELNEIQKMLHIFKPDETLITGGIIKS